MIDETNEQIMHRAKSMSDISKTYIISNAMGLIKIGQSFEPEKRVKQVESNSGIPCKLEYEIKGGFLERRAHEALSNYRTVGEWFECPIDVAIETLEELKRIDINNRYETLLKWKEHELRDKERKEKISKLETVAEHIIDALGKGEEPEYTIEEAKYVRKLAVDKLIEYFGSASNLATYLDTKPSTISGWQSRGHVGLHYAKIISEDAELSTLFPLTLTRLGIKGA